MDQVTAGHEYLRELFGVQVTHGWQIDMFSGYSGATPSLWATAGYDAMVLRWEGPWDMKDTWAANKWCVARLCCRCLT